MAFNTLLPKLPNPFGPVNAEDMVNYMASQESGLLSDKMSISGFLFDYADEVSAELKADITDHYTENNTVIQDHIALNPIRVTMSGLVGELVAGPIAGGLEGLLGGLQSSLTTVNAYIGGKTPQIINKASKAISQVQNVSNQLSSIVQKGKSLYSFLQNGTSSSVLQSKAYFFLADLWQARVPFVIETPYKIYTDMVIESMRAKQLGDTKYISEFTITLKQIRRAEVTISTIPNGATALNQAKEPQVNIGTEKGRKITEPELTSLKSFSSKGYGPK